MITSNGPSGFLPVDKPAGITSFDVIRELRRQLKIKKLGHSGVLDKPATGVLVVGANRATRLFELFNGFEKGYTAEIWFGLSTNTDDLSGELTLTGDNNAPAQVDVERVLADYTGTIDQIPPAFSLTKIGGKEQQAHRGFGQAAAALAAAYQHSLRWRRLRALAGARYRRGSGHPWRTGQAGAYAGRPVRAR
jgi:tRNA pseudouridine55 synthase